MYGNPTNKHNLVVISELSTLHEKRFGSFGSRGSVSIISSKLLGSIVYEYIHHWKTRHTANKAFKLKFYTTFSIRTFPSEPFLPFTTTRSHFNWLQFTTTTNSTDAISEQSSSACKAQKEMFFQAVSRQLQKEISLKTPAPVD